MAWRWFAGRAAALSAAWLAVAYPGAAPAPVLVSPQGAPAAANQPNPASLAAVVDRYCVRCHNPQLNSGNLALDRRDAGDVTLRTDVWEKVAKKLRARAMPPAGVPRPDDATYAGVIRDLEGRLDRAALAHPDPGRTEPFRRLNRTEYQNAVRDLLALDVDVADLLPRDDASFGFDNVSVVGLSPTLMERYLAAAQKISRLAVGTPLRAPASRVVTLPPDRTQEAHADGMPFGTRGGTIVSHTFPVDGQYAIRVQLSRDRNENVEGLTEPHDLELTLDGERLKTFTIVPNRNALSTYYADEGVDKGLEVRLSVKAGPHDVGAAFLQKGSPLVETERQPYQSFFNMDRHPRTQPAVRSVSIAGPYASTGVSDTPSRRVIFTCRPAAEAAPARGGSATLDQDACAETILAALARRAYRRPVTEADLEPLRAFYRDGRAEADFDAGIEMALRALLTSPEFLFRIERDPAGVAPGTAYKVTDVALASRLSFFIWSAPPDETLLRAAERGERSKPTTLEREVRRLLADPRASSLTTNFANQWLHLRNLAAASPDARMFPDFDDNLRQAFRRETELLFDSVVRENRPVPTLLTADYTFLNERLAKHYGIPNVYGDHFRKVSLASARARMGLLGHGSVLTVTSYATRTSPVLRGKWVLENVLGAPPPLPPPNVPPLADGVAAGRSLSMRERMAAHRANAACASCHQLMDPVGLAMEHFDAIGRWRQTGEGGTTIDAGGSLPGGRTFQGVDGLRDALAHDPELFVSTAAEKLLTFALGRGVDSRDRPAVRQILRAAAKDDYRFAALVVAIARSTPFQMRRSR